MADPLSILLALSGWAAWLSKEIISKLLDRSLTRAGRHGVIEGRARIFCYTESKGGGRVAVDYFEGMSGHSQYSDCTSFRAELECQFFNDTDTQVVYTKPELELWGIEGLRVRIFNPAVFVATTAGSLWQEAKTIVVAAHSVTPVRFEVPIALNLQSAEREIRERYGEAVVLLRVATIAGKASLFRICTRSFAGANKVVWPTRCKYPIFNVYSLNRDGRRAGRRPQERSMSLDRSSNDAHEELGH